MPNLTEALLENIQDDTGFRASELEDEMGTWTLYDGDEDKIVAKFEISFGKILITWTDEGYDWINSLYD